MYHTTCKLADRRVDAAVWSLSGGGAAFPETTRRRGDERWGGGLVLSDTGWRWTRWGGNLYGFVGFMPRR